MVEKRDFAYTTKEELVTRGYTHPVELSPDEVRKNFSHFVNDSRMPRKEPEVNESEADQKPIFVYLFQLPCSCSGTARWYMSSFIMGFKNDRDYQLRRRERACRIALRASEEAKEYQKNPKVYDSRVNLRGFDWNCFDRLHNSIIEQAEEYGINPKRLEFICDYWTLNNTDEYSGCECNYAFEEDDYDPFIMNRYDLGAPSLDFDDRWIEESRLVKAARTENASEEESEYFLRRLEKRLDEYLGTKAE